jgi:hypothetical protein
MTGLEQLNDTSASLLLAPSMSSETDAACLDLLSPTDPRDENVLWVTFTRSPDSCIQDWLAHNGERPANLRFISVGETVRSMASSPSSSAMQETPANAVIETLSNPGDLTGLGIKISEVLQQWQTNEHRTVACFHSLTALLQYSDVQTIYKFLHVLTGRFATAGVTAHFHLDPGAHDDQTINTLKSLFDGVAEFEDGEWSVRTR